MNLEIRELELSDKALFYKAKREWDDSEGFIFIPRPDEEKKMSFESYVHLLKDQRLGKNLPENFVPDTCLFAFLGHRIVGRVSLRHCLNDFLLKYGGHIGYGVLPSFRGQGIATKLLRHALKEAELLNIERALVTCDRPNMASARIIEKCGGVLENIIQTDGTGPEKKRYWIDLKKN